MAFDIGWAQAPDSLQGARGVRAAQGGLLYVFPANQLGTSAITVGNEAMDDDPRRINILECHVHVRNDTVDTIHVTWVLQPEGGNQAKYWQWFSCKPGDSATLTSAAGAQGFRDANPDLDERQWVPRGEQVEDVVSVIDEHTQAYSIMLATELATTMTIDNPNGGPATPRPSSGVPLGWGVAAFTIAGARAQIQGGDGVWTFGAPMATAGGYPVTSCALWISPNQPWACQVAYRLTDSRPIDLSHWYTLDGNGGATRNGVSMSADGSAAPPEAQAASDALLSASDRIAAAAAGAIRPA